MAFGRASAVVMRVWLVALFALSATLTGFSHRHAHAIAKLDLSAYTLPDGTVPVVCFGMGDGSDDALPGEFTRCEACLALSGANLPPPCPVVQAVDFGDGILLTPIEQTAAQARLPVRATSRDPPEAGFLVV